MDDENEIAETGKALTALRQERHAAWHQANMGVLHREMQGAWKSTNRGECLLFRQPGKPKADFYPSTGRWRVVGITKTFSGGAEGFVAWYRKQTTT